MRAAAPSIVAENISVWRLLGTILMMRRNCGMKPMSSRRSAWVVDDDDLNPIERRSAALDVIDQAAGARDQDVGALAQVVHLPAHRIATDHQHSSQLGVARENHEFPQHLRGQFAGGLDYQRGRTLRRFAMQPVDQWDQKGGGLAATGFGGRNDVMTTHDYRNSAGLDRGRLMMATIAN